MKVLCFVLLDHQRRVLAVPQAGVHTLPVFPQRVKVGVGFDSPHPFNSWFASNLGVTAYRRYAIDSEHSPEIYFIMEPASDGDYRPAAGRWVDPSQLEPHQQQIVSAIASSYYSSHTMPWISFTGFRPYLDWAVRILGSRGVERVTQIKQVKNAYVSTVFCLSTDDGDYYLKIVASAFIREVEIMRDILRWGIAPTVKVIAFHSNNEAYLMQDMGGCNLTNCLTEKHLFELVKLIAGFQQQVIKKVPAKELAAYYDLTLPTLIEQLDALIDTSQALLARSPYQLTNEEISMLMTKLSRYQAICAAVDADIPNSLDHGDLRPGNIRIDKNGRLLVYDWAWTTYTHPFFTVNNFLNIIRRNELVKPIKQQLVDSYLAEWTDYAPLGQLRNTYSSIAQLTYVYHAVIDGYWLEAAMQHYSNGMYELYSADGWLIDRRQYYYADVIRKLLR